MGRGASRERGGVVRRSLARFLADTSSSATVEYALLAAGVALAIVLGLMQLGVPGRSAARTLLRLRNQ
jgi:Flp pilus assembly pilin Flp